MSVRLQKLLAAAGIASRRKCEELIKQGLIKVNGQTVTQMGIIIDESKDIVEFRGQIIKPEQISVYYLLNKPKGYTSTCKDPFAKHTVLELVPPSPRVFPIGRLDKESRGLIILTNDGPLTNMITHPKYEHEKEYEVETSILSKQMDSQTKILNEISRMERGLLIDGKITNSVKVNQIKIDVNKKTINFNIVLKEGRNRQIRKMANIIGLRVLELRRIRIGSISLNDIPEGKYKKITREQLI